jgi:hypothetical protein
MDIPENCKKCVAQFVCDHESGCAFKVRRGKGKSKVERVNSQYEAEQEKRNKKFDF